MFILSPASLKAAEAQRSLVSEEKPNEGQMFLFRFFL